MNRGVFLATAALAAVSASAEVPRPEHPEPQFERSLWQNLNGAWEFEFDDANSGLDGGWESGAKKFGRVFRVPFFFESRRGGFGDTSFHPWVWSRRAFTAPAAWKGKHTL